jgi:hypothetical protein
MLYLADQDSIGVSYFTTYMCICTYCNFNVGIAWTINTYFYIFHTIDQLIRDIC